MAVGLQAGPQGAGLVPRPPHDKRADARSRETEFSGLPKTCKAYRNSSNGLTAGVWNNLYFDVFQFNYGGYMFAEPLAAVWTSIVVPETGIYECLAQTFVQGGAGEAALMRILSNGLDFFPVIESGGPANAGYAVQVLQTFSGPVELKAQDKISLVVNVTPNAYVDVSAYSWLSITKLGGQY